MIIVTFKNETNGEEMQSALIAIYINIQQIVNMQIIIEITLGIINNVINTRTCYLEED